MYHPDCVLLLPAKYWIKSAAGPRSMCCVDQGRQTYTDAVRAGDREGCDYCRAEQEYFSSIRRCGSGVRIWYIRGVHCSEPRFRKGRRWKTIILASSSRVLAFMKELDEELWKLGVLAKTGA